MISANQLELIQMFRRMPPEARESFKEEVRQVLPVAVKSADLRSYAFDPQGYVTRYLGWHPWSSHNSLRQEGDFGAASAGTSVGQAEVLEYYRIALEQQRERLLWEQGAITEKALKYYTPGMTIQNWLSVDAGHTVGKCGLFSDPITLANGEVTTFGDLVDKDFELLTLSDEGEVIKVRGRAEFNTIEPVYKVTTQYGKRITRNPTHPLWVAKGEFKSGKRPKIKVVGWLGVGEIESSDLVAVPESLPVWGEKVTLSDDEVKILAYLIGDGTMAHRYVGFTQESNPQLKEFLECIVKYGCTYSNKFEYQYKIRGSGKVGGNPVINLLRQHGLMGKHSRDKFIPVEVFTQPKRNVCLFLSRLFATDGWASVARDGKQKEIGFCTASERLARDIQSLMLRLGVHANLSKRSDCEAWSLSIRDAEAICAFCEHITIYGKEEAQTAVHELAKETAVTRRAAIAKRPDRPRWFHKDALPGTRWEKVVSVEAVGMEPTVAIEVPGYNTFLTDFYEHNTWLAAGLVSHFFDCFQPSISYCFAPEWVQLNDLLFKDIRTQRDGTNLPGEVLRHPRINYKHNHFVTSRSTVRSTTERIQGQHSAHMMCVIDEAEGVGDYVFDAVRSMASGSIAIVLVIRNPRTSVCRANQIRSLSHVMPLNISCFDTPNVVEDRDVIPGMVRRSYIHEMLEYTETVIKHDPERYTFELPWEPGVIYRPLPEFLWRVLGVTSEHSATNTFCTYGRYDAATKRGEDEPFIFGPEHDKATFGVDAARFGGDQGTVYIMRGDWLWRSAAFQVSDSYTFYTHIKEEMEKLVKDGVVHIEVRVDAGGGWGAGVIDLLNHDLELKYRNTDGVAEIREYMRYATTQEQRNNLKARIEQLEAQKGDNKWVDLLVFRVAEVNFDGVTSSPKDYMNLVTEMYAVIGKRMHVLKIRHAPKSLRADLCERPYEYGMKGGYTVKRLVSKEQFRRQNNRSPDDGDGATLAVLPSHTLKWKPLLLPAG